MAKEEKKPKAVKRWDKLISYLNKVEVGEIVLRKDILRFVYGHIPGKNPTSIDTYLLMLRGSNYLFALEPGKYVVDKIIIKNLDLTYIKLAYGRRDHCGDRSMEELIKNLRIAEYLNKIKESKSVRC